ncbi:MAG: response regulator [bacterium]
MPYNLLIVDDDKDFREEFVDSFEDYRIIEAHNGEEALKILGTPNEIDLVILDIKMPGLNGTEVLKRIKKASPDLGIIILTGYSSKNIAVEALKAHADDFMEKPLDIDKTKESIEKLLENKNEESSVNNSDLKGKIERIKRFAERNYHKKISLKDAASAVCLSPKYLSRIFKQDTGVGFSEYKLKIKIKKAQELLKRTGHNIDQISDEMGYQNIESFIRIFKKLTGNTPTEYRKKNKIKRRKLVNLSNGIVKQTQRKILKRKRISY